MSAILSAHILAKADALAARHTFDDRIRCACMECLWARSILASHADLEKAVSICHDLSSDDT